MSSEKPEQTEAAPSVISVNNIAKYYQIYNSPSDRLKQFIVPRLQRLAGKNASHYGREFKALDGISFEVRQGETIGIIGRNGSGNPPCCKCCAAP